MTVIPTEMSSELQVIDLSSNQIPELRKNEFKNMFRLRVIHMKNCTLKEINSEAFSGLTMLTELDFSNNNIKVLHPGTFKGFKELRTLMINNNEIEVLDGHLFKNLPLLRKVEFKQNYIHRIGLQTFVECPDMRKIALDSNRLSVLKPEQFDNMHRLYSLYSLTFSKNPLNCTCELQPFQKLAIRKKLNAHCYQPIHLRGKLLSDLRADNFACPPQIIQPKAGLATIDATNENVTLTCRIKSSSKPDILWLYNEQPLNDSDHRIQINESQETDSKDSLDIYTSLLIIVGVRSTDKGSYICSAVNNGGKDKAEINLTVPVPAIDAVNNGGKDKAEINFTVPVPATVDDDAVVVSSSSNLLSPISLTANILLTLLIIEMK